MSDPHSNHKDRGVVRYIGKVCLTKRDVRNMDNPSNLSRLSIDKGMVHHL